MLASAYIVQGWQSFISGTTFGSSLKQSTQPFGNKPRLEKETMQPSEESLDVLMAQLADGDRSAFAPVFEILWDPIYRLCLGLLQNGADAADAAQEAMQKILERAANYDRERPAMPWAMAIATWECRTIARRRSRRREVAENTLRDQWDSSPEEDFVRRNLAEAALTAMGELSDADKETFLATYWDESVSVSGTTLRKRRERALQRLRKTFRRLYGLD